LLLILLKSIFVVAYFHPRFPEISAQIGRRGIPVGTIFPTEVLRNSDLSKGFPEEGF
jgi:predicted transcriptional regulator